MTYSICKFKQWGERLTGKEMPPLKNYRAEAHTVQTIVMSEFESKTLKALEKLGVLPIGSVDSSDETMGPS